MFIYGDWGLGIGPNPQSPIPNPHNLYDLFTIQLTILLIILIILIKQHLFYNKFNK